MHMMDLMSSIILEGDGVTQELLDTILINLIPAHKVGCTQTHSYVLCNCNMIYLCSFCSIQKDFQISLSDCVAIFVFFVCHFINLVLLQNKTVLIFNIR